ncbi:MAG: LPXTG cell wall anchor domain-containing protein [Clostridium sp.]|uniref:LPXTG cell wall anchor domain-containing protein n=1 Tax=Clostridium sp. TaxID=1506 RepID=UPI0025C3B87C|nr:LPXTG cell wall anchor domain-containing protein [Clostridium sp.]MCF0148278.1 LPXTG cell wall anchor domain-containing protein [Clostridium sp.]
MKKLLFNIIIIIVFLNSFTIKSYGLDNNTKTVELIGAANGLVTIPDDSFLSASNMVPGDFVDGKIILKNNYNVPYKIMLKSERTYIDSDSEYDLLSKLQLRINYEDNIIYEGSACEDKKLAEEISLGIIYPGEEKILSASVELDGKTTGNEYKNKYDASKWVFTATSIIEDVKDVQDINLPNTGDEGFYIRIFVGVGLLLIGIYIYLGKRRIKNN